MAIAINLLKDKYSLSEKDYQKEKQYLQYSAVMFAFIFVVSTSMGLWSLFLSRRLSLAEADISRATAELANLADANAQQIYLKSRLNLITSFLSGRSVEREAMQKVFSIDIPGVVVSGAGFEGENTIRMQLTASNVESFAQAVDYLSKSSSFFTQVVSSGISRTQDSKYQMQILLTIPKK